MRRSGNRVGAVLLAMLLFMLPLAAGAESELCFVIDLDTLDMAQVRQADYIAEYLTAPCQGVRVLKWLEGDEAQRARLVVMDQTSGQLLLDKTYDAVEGRFDSGELYLPADAAAATYEITLLLGAQVYAVPYMRAPARLKDNTACTYGLRFSDGNGSLTDSWMMGTLLQLSDFGEGGTMTLPLCASNAYVLGSASVTVSGGQMCVSLSIEPTAQAEVKQAYVYVLDSVRHLTSITPKGIGIAPHALDEWFDVSGMDGVMLYVPVLLDYSPAGLPGFLYSLRHDDYLQRQLSLWDALWDR